MSTDSLAAARGASGEFGVAPAARNVARQSLSSPPAGVGASRASFPPPAPCLPLPGDALPAMSFSASSTPNVSRTSSLSPMSRRCSRYRRSCSLASTDQRLHAVEDGVGHFEFWHERKLFVASVAQQQRDAIRVHAEPGTGLGRIVHDDHVEIFCFELLSPARDGVVRLERKADDHRTWTSCAFCRLQYVGRRGERQRRRRRGFL